MKQFKYEIAHPELDQRRDRGMAKPAVSLARHAGEIAFGDGIADERADDLHRHFGVRPASKSGDRVGIEPRPGRGDVEATIAAQPCQHRIGKTERRGFAPRGDVMHAGSFLRLSCRRARLGMPSGQEP